MLGKCERKESMYKNGGLTIFLFALCHSVLSSDCIMVRYNLNIK